MNVSTVTIELSKLRTRVLGETDTSDKPVYKECCTPKRRWPEQVSPDAHAQVVISDNQWNSRDYCFGVCKKADSVNRSGTGSCWNCLCWLVWGYRVSCLAVIVIKDRLHGIDLCTEERRVCTSRPGLVGDPMTPCDIIPVYTNWSDECSVGLSPVGDIRIEYIGDPVDRGQSTDAAPLTELLDFYTLLHIYNNCATGSASTWTFCNTVWDNISSEELTRRCSVF